MDQGITFGTEKWNFLNKTHRQLAQRDNPQKKFWIPTAQGIDSTKKDISGLMLVYKIEDCIDLPEISKIKIKIDLSNEQKHTYNELKNELCTQLNGNYIVAKNNLSVLSKLSQITGGFVRNENDEIMQFSENPKFDALIDLINSIDENKKIIVWAWYTHEIDFLYNEVKKMGYSVDFVKGGMGHKVHDVLSRFKNDTRILIANQAVIGHGHSFTFCNYMIFYSNTFDWEIRHQSERRIARIGQNSKMFIYDLVCKDTIDVKLVTALSSKESMHDFLTNPITL